MLIREILIYQYLSGKNQSMEKLAKLQMDYFHLLNKQQFRGDQLDYSKLDQHLIFLRQLAKIENSAITIFDLYKKEHVFASYNFAALFGYSMQEIEEGGTEFFNSKIHPDDFIPLMEIGIKMLRYFYQLPQDKRADFKLINEYRIRKEDGTYTRVIEQHQALELDQYGNVWLALSVVDHSPNQVISEGVNSQVLNFKTGEVFSLVEDENTRTEEIQLTKRESEVLSLIKKGFLSKEISEMLSISLHTVNTHRQRILKKLNANNSMEAVQYASRFGLVD